MIDVSQSFLQEFISCKSFKLYEKNETSRFSVFKTINMISLFIIFIKLPFGSNYSKYTLTYEIWNNSSFLFEDKDRFYNVCEILFLLRIIIFYLSLIESEKVYQFIRNTKILTFFNLKRNKQNSKCLREIWNCFMIKKNPFSKQKKGITFKDVLRRQCALFKVWKKKKNK